MRRSPVLARALALGLAVVAGVAAPAAGAPSARRHTVERGQTLEHVARAYGCSTEAVLRANRLRTTLVPAGTVVAIPACSLRARAQTRERLPGADDARRRASSRRGRADAPRDDDERARRALAVIDGTARTTAARTHAPSTILAEDAPADAGADTSIGVPWRGRLRNAARLPAGDGYQIRRPQRAYGAAHVVEHLRGAIATVRALHPHVHTLAIGDLSARSGGHLPGHRSHQSGLDVDLGLYFRVLPEGYPDHFAPADAHLDLAATWALITAFARTVDLDSGVELIFLDANVQARLHRWARARGTPEDQLAELLQYPRGADVPVGLVRHWPNHADHLHVRFKAR